MIRLFCGYDEREAAGFHAFVQSVIETASEPVSIIPLTGQQRDGTNAFTYVRFLVPYLCDFEGYAIFADGADMLMRDDIAKLWRLRVVTMPVQVVKHDYQTKHKRKYVGTEMEASNNDYPRKNWSSVIVYDCGHEANRVLTPEYVAKHDGAHLHRFGWLTDEQIGELPKDWNWLADEYGENQNAKLIHWTAGIPGFYQYRHAPHSDEWRLAVRNAQRGID